MDAALHDGYGNTGEGAENEAAGVTSDGGLGEVGDVGVGDDDGGAVVPCSGVWGYGGLGGLGFYDGGLDLCGEVAQARAEDNSERGAERSEDRDVGGGGFGAGVEVGHRVTFQRYQLCIRKGFDQ